MCISKENKRNSKSDGWLKKTARENVTNTCVHSTIVEQIERNYSSNWSVDFNTTRYSYRGIEFIQSEKHNGISRIYFSNRVEAGVNFKRKKRDKETTEWRRDGRRFK